MSKVLIDRELAERVCHVDNSTRQTARRELRTILAAPSGTPAMPVKAYYHEWTDLEGVRTRSVGLEVRKEFTDAPLVLESDAMARIACLEGEIAKRDEELAACRVAVENCELFRARIAELEGVGIANEKLTQRIKELKSELSALKAQEPVELEYPEYHAEGMGCGLEDRGITDRYEAMAYGFQEAVEQMATIIGSAGPLYAAPVSEAKAQGVVMPDGWIPLTIEHEPGYPEDVAFGPKRMMDRLKKWLDRYFEMRLNAAPVQQVSVPDGFCIGAWRDALEKIAKYAPQVNCAARTELERAGLIAVHALIAFSAPQFRHARGTQTASNAAPAAPAADGWISVSERLPGEDDQVLCWCEDETVAWAEVSSHHNSFFTDMTHELLPVTHWMPLPAGPVAHHAKGVV